VKLGIVFGFYSGDSSALSVYTCAGDGSVLQHRTGHFMDDAVDVNALILKTNGLKVCTYMDTYTVLGTP